MVGRSTVQEQIRLLPDCFSLPEANKPACLLERWRRHLW